MSIEKMWPIAARFFFGNGVLPWRRVSMRVGGKVHLARVRDCTGQDFWKPVYGKVDELASGTVTIGFARQISLQFNTVNRLNQRYIIASTGSVYRNSWGKEEACVATLIAF